VISAEIYRQAVYEKTEAMRHDGEARKVHGRFFGECQRIMAGLCGVRKVVQTGGKAGNDVKIDFAHLEGADKI
jgi:hypothetical protein